ncbi:ornithine cyclodeaminase family protein [Enterococcus sp. AZ103]|uniref:ornithine cyclodeaminase family protein n=1 Tax=Enterococcus sp. AZ103 TaxID=2774628 RepID=UPI003F2664AF
MEILTKEEIKQFFSMKDCIATVEDAFLYFYEGKVEVPLRTQIQTAEKKGTFLCMPAYCADYDASCVKVLNMFPGNIDNGLSSINAQILVMDTKTGLFNALLDGNYVTQLRTGAATGVAIKYLARKEATIGALIGTGGQAATQLEAMTVAADLKEIRVSDLNFDRAKKFVETMKKELNTTIDIRAVQNSDQAISDADIIVTVTPSTKPVFNAEKVKQGALISGIGSYQPQLQEVPAELVKSANKIYFDSEEAVLSEAGDILIPLSNGIVTKEDFTGDIGAVIKGELVGRENQEEIIFFKTVGIAAQDLFASQAIFKKMNEKNSN